MKVLNKKDNKIYDVHDITYDTTGYPHFLIYTSGQWVRMSAKHFVFVPTDNDKVQSENHDK